MRYLIMRQMKKKLVGAILFCMLLMFAMPVMASNSAEKKEIKTPAQTVEHSIKGQNTKVSTAQLNRLKKLNNYNDLNCPVPRVGSSSNSYFLTEILPRTNDVITQGERLYVKFLARDTYKYYFTKPIVSIFDANSEEIVYSNFDQDTVSVSGQDSYSGYLFWDTNAATPGRYFVYIVNAPCNVNGVLENDWTTFDCPYIKTYFTLQAKTPVHSHTYGAWKTIKAATVFKAGEKERNCTTCGEKETQSIPKLKATVKISSTKKTIKRNKSYTLKITKLAKGDSVKSVKSSKKSVATVKKVKTNQYKITGKKKGKATITVVLKSGKKATCKITVK